MWQNRSCFATSNHSYLSDVQPLPCYILPRYIKTSRSIGIFDAHHMKKRRPSIFKTMRIESKNDAHRISKWCASNFKMMRVEFWNDAHRTDRGTGNPACPPPQYTVWQGRLGLTARAMAPFSHLTRMVLQSDCSRSARWIKLLLKVVLVVSNSQNEHLRDSPQHLPLNGNNLPLARGDWRVNTVI